MEKNQVDQVQIDSLLEETKKINQEIKETSQQFESEVNNLEASIDESINSLEQIYSDLDKVDQEGEQEIDKLVLKQVDNLSKE